jgi:hypothetical protein
VATAAVTLPAARRPRRSQLLRRPRDPHDLCVDPSPGTRSTEEAFEAARRLKVVIGPDRPVIDRYVEALSWADPTHVELFGRLGGLIVFAPTIPDGLHSDRLAFRRSKPLSETQRRNNELNYGPESGTLAVYAPEIDAVVLPTTYVGPDLERTVHHEIGHGLTLHAAYGWAEGAGHLLKGLPPGIVEHLDQPSYGIPGRPGTTRLRVLEALAEAYAYICVGRAEELPPAIVSAVMDIMATMERQRRRPRSEIDEITGITASRALPSEIIRADDPDLGYLFDPRKSDPNEREVPVPARARGWPPTQF